MTCERLHYGEQASGSLTPPSGARGHRTRGAPQYEAASFSVSHVAHLLACCRECQGLPAQRDLLNVPSPPRAGQAEPMRDASPHVLLPPTGLPLPPTGLPPPAYRAAPSPAYQAAPSRLRGCLSLAGRTAHGRSSWDPAGVWAHYSTPRRASRGSSEELNPMALAHSHLIPLSVPTMQAPPPVGSLLEVTLKS